MILFHTSGNGSKVRYLTSHQLASHRAGIQTEALVLEFSVHNKDSQTLHLSKKCKVPGVAFVMTRCVCLPPIYNSFPKSILAHTCLSFDSCKVQLSLNLGLP
jgi:hypothetical protein